MAIIVEDGTIVTNANSYNSIAQADDYFTFQRPGVTDWIGFDSTLKEASLRYAAILLDGECWNGHRAQPLVQALAWPRNLVWYEAQRRYFTASEIPVDVRYAQLELALAVAREDRSLVAEGAGGGGLERVKVDVLEVEWMQDAAKLAEDAKGLIPDIVYRFIDEYLYCDRNGITANLYRA